VNRLLRGSNMFRLFLWCSAVLIVLVSGFVSGMKLEEETR